MLEIQVPDVIPDDQLIDLIGHAQGMLTTPQLQQAGYTLADLRQLCQEGQLVAVRPGQYRLAEMWEEVFFDALIRLQWVVPEGIYAGLTALSFHNLTVLLPGQVDMCVPAGWKGRIPPAWEPVHLLTLPPDLREYGVMSVYPTPPGTLPVRMYRPEVAVAQVLADPMMDREAQEECVPMYRHRFTDERALAEALERYQVTTIPTPYYPVRA